MFWWLTGGIAMKQIETTINTMRFILVLTGGIAMKQIETLIGRGITMITVDRWYCNEANWNS